MKKVKIKNICYIVWVLMLLMIIAPGVEAQQETMFTQYMSNVLTINPAYAGSKNTLSLSAVARNQWVGIDGAPETQCFSVHSPFSKYNMGIGLSFVRDKIGPITQTGINFNYSYTLTLSPRHYLAMGLKGGVNFYYANYTDLSLIDSDDPVFMEDKVERYLPNVGLGLYYYSDRFYVGLSAPKLIENVINSYSGYSSQYVNREELHLFLMSGYVFDVNRFLKFKPHFMVRYVKNAPLSVDLSGQFLICDLFWVGAMYRIDDSAGALLHIPLTPRFQIGYSYDFSINDMGTFNHGTHEFTVCYDFDFGREKIKSPRYF